MQRARAAEQSDLVVPTPLPVYTIDPQKLRLIPSNLLDNALKYSAPESRVMGWAQALQDKECVGVACEVVNAVGRAGRPDAQRLGGTLTLRETEDVRFALWIPCDPAPRAVA